MGKISHSDLQVVVANSADGFTLQSPNHCFSKRRLLIIKDHTTVDLSSILSTYVQQHLQICHLWVHCKYYIGLKNYSFTLRLIYHCSFGSFTKNPATYIVDSTEGPCLMQTLGLEKKLCYAKFVLVGL